jgi:hypothetical protein
LDLAALNTSIGKLQKVLDNMLPVMGNYQKTVEATTKPIKELTKAQKALGIELENNELISKRTGNRVNEFGEEITKVGDKMLAFNKRSAILSETIKELNKSNERFNLGMKSFKEYQKRGGNLAEYLAEFISSSREEITIFGVEAAKARKVMYGFLPPGMFRMLNKVSSSLQLVGGQYRKLVTDSGAATEEIQNLKEALKLATEEKEIIGLQKRLQDLQEPPENIFGTIFKGMQKINNFAKSPIQFKFETDKFFEGMKEVEKETTKFGKIKKFFRITPTVEDKRMKAGLKDTARKIMDILPFSKEDGLKIPQMLNVDERKEVANIKKEIKTIEKTLKGSKFKPYDFPVQFNTPEMEDFIDNKYIQRQEQLINDAQNQIGLLNLSGITGGDEINKYNEQIKLATESLTDLANTRKELGKVEAELVEFEEKTLKLRDKLEVINQKEISAGRLTRLEKREQFKINAELNQTLFEEQAAREQLADINQDYKKSIEGILASTKDEINKLNKKGQDRFIEQIDGLKKSAKEYKDAFAGILPIVNKTSQFGLNTNSDLAKATDEVKDFEAKIKELNKNRKDMSVLKYGSEMLKAERGLADAKQKVSDITGKSINDFKTYNGILKGQKELLRAAKDEMDKFSLVPENLEEGQKSFEVQAENIQKVISSYNDYQKELEKIKEIESNMRFAKALKDEEAVAKLTEQLSKAGEKAEKLKEMADEFGDAEEIVRLTENMKYYEEQINNVTNKKKELLKNNNAIAFQLEMKAIQEVIKAKEKNIKKLEKEISLNEKQIALIEEQYAMGEITQSDRDALVNPLMADNESKKQSIEDDKSVIAEKEEEKSNTGDMLKEFKMMRRESLKNLLSKHKFFRNIFKVTDFFKALRPALGMIIRGMAASFVYLSLAIVAMFLIIKKAWPVISSAFEKAFKIVRPIFDAAFYFFGLIKSGVIDVLDGFFGSGGLESVIDGLAKIAIGLLGGALVFASGLLALAITFIGTFAMELWTKAKEFVVGTFTDIKQFAKNIAVILGIVGVIVALIAGAPVWLAALVGLALFKVGKWLVRKMKKIFDFDMFASGGTSKGGMAVVGEEGPELVNLPKGARVFSNSDSKAMVGGKTQNVVNNFNITVNAKDTSQAEMKRLADMIGRDISAKINRSTSTSTFR